MVQDIRKMVVTVGTEVEVRIWLNGKRINIESSLGFHPGSQHMEYLLYGILRMKMPEGTSLSGYAEDIAPVTIARDVMACQMQLNRVMHLVSS